MSGFFVRKFKDSHKCIKCKKDKLSSYTLCATHLEEAKLAWRQWAVERRESGKCCYCDRKSFRGWLRCRFHTEYNREICKRWMREHPEHSAQQWKQRKELRDMGFCPSCKEHRKLSEGFKRCEVCRTLHAVTRRVNNPVSVREVQQLRANLRKGLTTTQEIVNLRA